MQKQVSDVRKYLDPRVLAKISGLEMRARLVVEGFFAGLHHSPHHGVSIEFADHRQYTQGDDLRFIDWKVFGRTDKYYIKEYEQESNLSLLLVVDCSESMNYRSSDELLTKHDYATSAAAALAYLTIRQHDSVGLALFDDKITHFVRPANNAHHWRTIIQEMAGRTGPSKTSIGRVLGSLAERLTHRSIIVLLSDLFDDVDSILLGVKQLRYRRHEVIVWGTWDPAELTLPFEGPTMFEGLEALGSMLTEPESLREKYVAEVQRFQAQLRAGLGRMFVDFAAFNTGHALDALISGYLATRSARLRQRTSRVLGSSQMLPHVLMQWPFVHPSLAAAAVASGLIPLIIHWLNRRRYRRVPWAAMMFLRAAGERSTTRLWFERWLLLLVRAAVIMLLGFAIARPFFPATRFVPLPATRSHQIVVLDDSLSMRAVDEAGKSRFDRAKRCAQRLMQSFPENDAISLVTLSKPAQAPVRHASYDRRFVRERLDALQATEAATDAAGGLNVALDIVRQSPAARENRSIYVLSDFAATTWASEGSATPSAAMTALRGLADELTHPGTSLNLISITDKGPQNVAITQLELESPILGLGSPARLLIEASNFGSVTARDLKIRTARHSISGNAPVSDTRITDLPALEPGQKSITRLSMAFDAIGVHGIEATLLHGTQMNRRGGGGAGSDALLDDDSRYLSVDVRPSTSALIVDGRIGSTALAGQAGFLATALAPKSETNEATVIQPKIVSESEFALEPFKDYDLIALCNVSRLSAEQWKQIEQFVEDSGGLMVFAGDQLSVENYNRFGYADGHGVLPVRLGHVKSLEEPSTLGFKIDPSPSPILAEVAGEPTSGLFSASVTRYLPVDAESVRGQVVLRYSNEDAALVVAPYRLGRVALCTTTANMDWTNLPAKGDFVTLVLNTVGYIAPTHGQQRNRMICDMLLEPLTAAELSQPTRLTTSDGTIVEGRIVPSATSIHAQFGPLVRSGLYAVTVGAQSRAVAVNVDTDESALTGLAGPAFKQLLDRPMQWVDGPDLISERNARANVTEIATMTAYLVLALLIVETWLAAQLGSGRRVARADSGFLKRSSASKV